MNIPETLKYTPNHEWVQIKEDIAIVGITEFAQSELGDIVFIEVDTIDINLNKEDVFGTIEAVKTVSDMYMPLSGKIIEFNPEIENNPEIVNQDPYKTGWIIKLKIKDESELEGLLDHTAYKASL